MEFEQIIKLIDTVSKSGISSFSFEEGGQRIVVGNGTGLSSAATFQPVNTTVLQPSTVQTAPLQPVQPVNAAVLQAQPVQTAQVQQAAQVQAAQPAAPSPSADNTAQMSVQDGQTAEPETLAGNTILSPLVGKFYAAPSEDAEAFVRVGDVVKKGQVLGIVEAMKLMNEIESEYDGVVKQIMVSNEESVQYGQPLFLIA